MNISLFVPCFVDTLFPSAAKAMVEVLERLGHQVDVPPRQTCCGQIHVNSGYRDEATSLARHFVEVFEGSEVVVAPSASCVGLVHDVYLDLARESGDVGLAEAVEAVLPRLHEFSQFVADVLGVDDVGAYFPHRVTLHTSCHSIRVLKVGDAPQRFLAGVKRDRGGAAAACRRVLRVRWHFRGQERRHLGGDAVVEGGERASHRRRVRGGGGQLLPYEHRRSPLAPEEPGSEPCIWPKCSPPATPDPGGRRERRRARAAPLWRGGEAGPEGRPTPSQSGQGDQHDS